MFWVQMSRFLQIYFQLSKSCVYEYSYCSHSFLSMWKKDAIYSKMHGQHMSRKDVNPGHWLWEHFSFTIVINIAVHIRRSGLCKLISQAVLYERRGTNDPWQYLISCLMTYRYSAELTVDMVSYLSTWWASWVVEVQIILGFGLEKCLIRLSLPFPFSWYIPLLSCSY